MKELRHRIDMRCPDATITLETVESKSSVEWLLREHLGNFRQ